MKNKKKKRNFLFYLLMGGLFIKLLAFVFGKNKNKNNEPKASNKHPYREFLGKEEKEIEKFIFGKESFKEFCTHTLTFLKDAIIPHENNDHKPKILRTKSLLSIIFGLLAIKLFLGAYLFLAYPNSAHMSESLVARVFELLNKERVGNNIEPLSRDLELSRAAMAKAEDMLTNNYFDHYGPDGKKPWEWIHRTEYDYIYAGENLAMNFTAAESVHAALMNSESHKKNILSEKYNDIGLAMVSGTINGKQTNVLVQTFGHKRKIVSPISAIAKTEVQAEPLVGEIENKITQTLPEAEDENDDKQIEVLPQVDLPEIEEINLPEENDLTSGGIASTSASSTQDIKKQDAIIKKVSIIVKDVSVIEDNTTVMAEKNYLEIDNDTLVTIKTAPEIIGKDAMVTHKKLKLVHGAYIVIASIIGLLLIINIFIKIKVQHKSVIIQSIFTIVFIISLIYFKIHYLENELVDILLL
jgi:hypothetical protein